MKKVYLFAIFILLIGSAYSVENIKYEDCYSLLLYKDKIIGFEIDSSVPVDTEIINVYINNSIYGSVDINRKVIEDISCDKNEDATYSIYIKGQDDIFDIYNAEDKVGKLLEKIKNKNIVLKGETFSKKIKGFFINLGIKIFSSFM